MVGLFPPTCTSPVFLEQNAPIPTLLNTARLRKIVGWVEVFGQNLRSIATLLRFEGGDCYV
jgi:hypothetical protein